MKIINELKPDVILVANAFASKIFKEKYMRKKFSNNLVDRIENPRLFEFLITNEENYDFIKIKNKRNSINSNVSGWILSQSQKRLIKILVHIK